MIAANTKRDETAVGANFILTSACLGDCLFPNVNVWAFLFVAPGPKESETGYEQRKGAKEPLTRNTYFRLISPCIFQAIN